MNIPQMAGGIYSFSNYFILRPKCGLPGLKGEELALCRRVGGNPSKHLQDRHSVEERLSSGQAEEKDPHYFEIMSIIA